METSEKQKVIEYLKTECGNPEHIYNDVDIINATYYSAVYKFYVLKKSILKVIDKLFLPIVERLSKLLERTRI